MLGKIIKHEFKATYKTALMMVVSTILAGGLVRMMDIIPFNGTVWQLVKTVADIFYILLLVAVPFSMFVIMVVRFYRTMVKDEGYLTHTLPVKKSQLINGKMITALVWIVVSVLIIPVSLLIGVKDSTFIFHDITGLVKTVFSNQTYIIDLVLLVIMALLSVMNSLLICYASIGMGQMFTGHRLAGAVLFYFVFKYVFSFIMIFSMVLIPSVAGMMEKYDTLNRILMAEDNGMMALMMFVLPYEIISGIVYYAITCWRFSKKLNLE